MAWMIRRKAKDGGWQYLGGYRDPTGRPRSAGSFTTHRDALRAATQAEVKVGEGTWIDRQSGKITFQKYVETVVALPALGGHDEGRLPVKPGHPFSAVLRRLPPVYGSTMHGPAFSGGCDVSDHGAEDDSVEGGDALPVRLSGQPAWVEEGALPQDRRSVGGLEGELKPRQPGQAHLGAQPKELARDALLDAPEVDDVSDGQPIGVAASTA